MIYNPYIVLFIDLLLDIIKKNMRALILFFAWENACYAFAWFEYILSAYHLKCRFAKFDLREYYQGINFKVNMIVILLSVFILNETRTSLLGAYADHSINIFF